ncbi:hypothetical protein O181_026550 [Austropuccinia psidii MF-1]|uniref:Uncharacterized protein n=1 Tax=Austropuccinia psidii MF-1 TaxID=1389203 RepID=A0A9Q3H2A4_9BASI|nr:hypothetical protein [Austropuccinia psidii MF-1]
MLSFFLRFSLLVGAAFAAQQPVLDPPLGSPPAIGYLNNTAPKQSWTKTVKIIYKTYEIQQAQCARNIRVGKQKFSWFKIDEKRMNVKNSTYGFCFATDREPTPNDMEPSNLTASYFWFNFTGMSNGVGVGPVRDPNTGVPGYNSKDGKFHPFPPGYQDPDQPSAPQPVDPKPVTNPPNPKTKRTTIPKARARV